MQSCSLATGEWSSAVKVAVAGVAELPTKEAREPNCSNSAMSTEAGPVRATIPAAIIKPGELSQRIAIAELAAVEAITAIGFATAKAVIE